MSQKLATLPRYHKASVALAPQMYFRMRGNYCNYCTIDESNINLSSKKAETFTCKAFEILSAHPNYCTIDESNINLRYKKAETFTCQAFEILSLHPNYCTIDE